MGPPNSEHKPWNMMKWYYIQRNLCVNCSVCSSVLVFFYYIWNAFNSLIPLNRPRGWNWVNVQNFSRCAQLQQPCECCLESQPQHPLPLYFLMGSVVLYPVLLMMCLFSHGNSNMHASRFWPTEMLLLYINALKVYTDLNRKSWPSAIYQVTLWEPTSQSSCDMWRDLCPHNAINTCTFHSNGHSCLDKSTLKKKCVYNRPPHLSHLVIKVDQYLFS